MMSRRLPDAAGITRAEVIVALMTGFLLLVLVLLLLGRAREASRRNVCDQRIGLLARSIFQLHESENQLPPAAIWSAEGVQASDSLFDTTRQLQFIRQVRPIELTRSSWMHFILPIIGEELAFNPNVPITDHGNAQGRTAIVTEQLCPSDEQNKNPYVLRLRDRDVSFARGNYAMNGGSQNIYESPGWLTNPRASGVSYEIDSQRRTFALWGNGVAGINKRFSYRDFKNGLGTTVLLDEVRAGITAVDPRGVWALGQIGSTITWGHGANGDACGPNAMAADADDITGCVDMHRALGSEFLQANKMPCCAHCYDNNQATARSQHLHGVYVAMADGATRFIADDVDVGLWHVLHSRFTPSTILDARSVTATASTSVNTPREPREPNLETMQPEANGDTPTEITNSLGMAFREIPAGEFIMGLPNRNNASPFPSTAPPHSVRISKPFTLGIHEVTVSQFNAIMGNHHGDTVDNDLPVTNVTWYDAHEFCRLLSLRPEEKAAGRSYRLPTEAEWEYASRAGSMSPFAFSKEWTAESDASGIIGGKDWKEEIPIVPVGSYAPNAFGIHDMCGSVFEWTNDWYRIDYYARSPLLDPPGPAHGYLRVVRGWYWLFTGPACVANPSTEPWNSSPYIGFRVVCYR
jgi:formylglycine-generating enzyme required for sulfatase activity